MELLLTFKFDLNVTSLLKIELFITTKLEFKVALPFRYKLDSKLADP